MPKPPSPLDSPLLLFCRARYEAVQGTSGWPLITAGLSLGLGLGAGRVAGALAPGPDGFVALTCGLPRVLLLLVFLQQLLDRLFIQAHLKF